ncbi:hypothetical protein [Rhodococcus sp. 3-2]|uniref:hypothetical protein n=1 Tax=Rhodococcus sp. 3-2 TaxID=2890836 RepID=UPI001D18248E|nr:hypothetical protein [Rhodococcus sp. 3-2]MCC4300413.1 hypothetical protein [Rhodococcus sp. 3-2]MCC4300473.1 hypothetical protein [Rhodococcus sp. 3-2]
MDLKTARAAIEAILASIPDEELPEFDRVEYDRKGLPTVWWGGSGYCLGSAKSGEKRDPLVYRARGSWDAVEAEMTYRADKRLHDNGDDPRGIRLAKTEGE